MGSRLFLVKKSIGLLTLCLVTAWLLVPALAAAAAEDPATTRVKHKPIPYFVPGSRILLDAEVSDKSGIKLVRCYFKADDQAEYVFVPMTESSSGRYRAVLPAPAEYADRMTYLFLVVNRNEQVVKTHPFQVQKSGPEKEPPQWQQTGTEGDLSIYTELPDPPGAVAGFSDSVTIDAVESSLRFGVVSGLYSVVSGSAGSTTGAAAAATSAGSISGTAGLSTTAIVATAAGVAAGAGAIAAVSDSSDGSKDAVNPSASISWGDARVPPQDSFQAVLGKKNLGTASSIKRISGLRVGHFDLRIRAVSIAEEYGLFIVELSGGAYFEDDGGTRKESELAEGQSVVYPLFVPDTGSARIEW